MISQPRRGQVLSRVVLPLVLFVAVVGSIAWVTQNMPHRARTRTETGGPKQVDTPAAPILVRFERDIAEWDAEDPTYFKEFERDVPGHYDYPFENVSGKDLEMGLSFSNCDCSRVEACVLSPEEWKQYKAEGSPPDKKLPWMPLERSDTKGITVPKDAHGLARVNWKNKKSEGQTVLLIFKLWFHPEGDSAQRQMVDCRTPLKIVSPLMFQPEEVRLGSVTGQASAGVVCWSATRTEPELKFDPLQKHPCYEYHIQPLTDRERTALEKLLRSDEKNPRNTRVRSAFGIKVTVHEERAGKYLDQGHFWQNIPLVLDGERLAGPVVRGAIRGELVVGGVDDDGKILLKSFPALEGLKRVVAISAEPKTELQVVSSFPAFIKATLELNKQETSDARKVFKLTVEIPPSAVYGPLPEDAVIILRSQNAQSRLIRIPVHGNAVQS